MISDCITFAANMDTVPQMMDFIREQCEGLPEQAAFDITLVCEEILVNIASYAYPDGEGELAVRWSNDTDNQKLTFSFEDSGIPFNPLLKEAPDLNVPVAERLIGGLGIMMVRKLMDTVQYARAGDKNVLTITKGY